MVAERQVVEGLLRVHVHVDVQVRVGAVHVVDQRQGVAKQFFTLACRAAKRLDRAMSEIGIPQRMLGQEAQPGRHLGDAVLAGRGVGAGQRHPDLRAAERGIGRAAGGGQRAVHDQVGAAQRAAGRAGGHQPNPIALLHRRAQRDPSGAGRKAHHVRDRRYAVAAVGIVVPVRSENPAQPRADGVGEADGDQLAGHVQQVPLDDALDRVVQAGARFRWQGCGVRRPVWRPHAATDRSGSPRFRPWQRCCSAVRLGAGRCCLRTRPAHGRRG